MWGKNVILVRDLKHYFKFKWLDNILKRKSVKYHKIQMKISIGNITTQKYYIINLWFSLKCSYSLYWNLKNSRKNLINKTENFSQFTGFLFGISHLESFMHYNKTNTFIFILDHAQKLWKRYAHTQSYIIKLEHRLQTRIFSKNSLTNVLTFKCHSDHSPDKWYHFRSFAEYFLILSFILKACGVKKRKAKKKSWKSYVNQLT